MDVKITFWSVATLTCAYATGAQFGVFAATLGVVINGFMVLVNLHERQHWLSRAHVCATDQKITISIPFFGHKIFATSVIEWEPLELELLPDGGFFRLVIKGTDVTATGHNMWPYTSS